MFPVSQSFPFPRPGLARAPGSRRIRAHCPNNPPYLRNRLAATSVLAVPTVPVEVHQMQRRFLLPPPPHLPQLCPRRVGPTLKPRIERLHVVGGRDLRNLDLSRFPSPGAAFDLFHWHVPSRW